MKSLVVGAGAAGTAAAWALRRRGADVVVVDDRPGATALFSGALDLVPWEESFEATALPADLTLLGTELGWVLGPERARIATSAGVLRPARGREGSLLDLAPLAGKLVAVADLLRDDWDGPALARAFAGCQWAERTGTRFEARALELASGDADRRIPVWDFAASFDDPERQKALLAALRDARGDADAWLLGPWLGVTTDVAERLRVALEMPLGEATSPLGGPAGSRFERARNALFDKDGISTRRGRVSAISREKQALVAVIETATGSDDLAVDRVVLAIGGVATGGIVVDPAHPTHAGGACFHPSLDVPVGLELDGRAVDAVSTLHGVDFVAHGIGVLERVGIAAKGASASGAPGVFVAGDCVAGRARTVLEAARAGIAAGQAASA